MSVDRDPPGLPGAAPQQPDVVSFGTADSALADDLELIARRDLAALNRLFNATYGRLLPVCLRITRNAESAEDVLQEVYIKVWNRAAGYDRTLSRPMAWLGRLARNSAIDWYRAQSRRPTTTLLDHNALRDDAVPIDEKLIAAEQHDRAMALVSDLRDVQQNAIRDIFLEGLTYAELAHRDGVPLGTVKSRIHRTLAQLSQKWHHD